MKIHNYFLPLLASLFPILIIACSGSTGEQGEQGEQGIQGIQGIQGEDGEKGEQGEQGIQGETGEPGADGKDGLPTLFAANGKSYKLDGVYKEKTITATNGNMGGYAAAKLLCEQTLNNSATAHMCSAEEMIRSAQLGLIDAGEEIWYSSGTFSFRSDDMIAFRDCTGWTSSGEVNGSTWSVNNYPTASVCSNSLKVACCD